MTNRTSFVWGTTRVGDGSHIISLVEHDKVENLAETSINVFVNNTKHSSKTTPESIIEDKSPPDKLNQKIYLAIAVGIGLIIGIAVIWAASKR